MKPRLWALAAVLVLAGCEGDPAQQDGGERRGRGSGGGMARGGGERAGTAVPVEVAPVTLRSISSYIETNGTLEAESEVDIVARTTGPIVSLSAEEGDPVRQGQVVARLDDLEHRADLEIARVTLEETRLAFERAQKLQLEQMISPESFEQARSAYETAEARLDAARLLLGYTEIRAPFDGLIVRRYVNLAQQVSANMALFRISDFTPLLCPIQVPERELPRLRVGQRAHVTVEPFPGQRFGARVLRISPVVQAATGTVKVTLDVNATGKLRPGMFARVYVETESHPDAMVIPKSALSLESIGDTVYVADGGKASRRAVELGFREGNFVEVVSGLAAGEQVVVVGQDGLSEGTPVQVLEGAPATADGVAAPERRLPGGEPRVAEGPDPGRGRPADMRPDLSRMSPEQIERMKQRMRERGMTDEQIEERLRQARERSGADGTE